MGYPVTYKQFLEFPEGTRFTALQSNVEKNLYPRIIRDFHRTKDFTSFFGETLQFYICPVDYKLFTSKIGKLL